MAEGVDKPEKASLFKRERVDLSNIIPDQKRFV